VDTESQKSLMNIGDLAKPVDTFIKKVSAAIGTLYEPVHVRKMAKAEVDADKIRTLGRIELSEIEERGLRRMVAQQARAQKNVEEITQKAIGELKEDAEPEKLDGDWVSLFFEECQHVSNPEMQNLWANILAGEANKSGTFSIRTIKLLGSIGKADAELFTQLCGFSWYLGEICPLIFEMNDPIYSDCGISFSSLNDLAALGLISVDGFGITKSSIQAPARAYYFGTSLMLDSSKVPSANVPLVVPIGHVTLTKSGRELAGICGATAKEGFIEYVVRRWATPKFAETSLSAFSEWPRPIPHTPSSAGGAPTP
jgi:hypothetical protein